MSANTGDVEVALITDPADFTGAFIASANAFGHQIHDAIWISFSPRWDTPEGLAAGADRLVKRWAATTHDKHGRPNTVFLKATVPDPDHPGERRIAGIAIWAQLSMVPGYGEVPSTDFGKGTDLKAMYGEDEATQRLACQVWASLVSRRVETVRAKEKEELPATFVLDMCAVDPAFQRRGIAMKLVQWGLDEAKRRGGLESTTEASVMGRHVYAKLGFKPVAEIGYEVDPELVDGKTLPSNLFMRTGP